MSASVVMRRACASCPFRRDGDGAFPPASLDASVGENLRGGFYAHNCHTTNGSEHPKVCAGYVAFVLADPGARPCVALGLAERMGVFDPERDRDRASPFETRSWEAVLAMHRERLVGVLHGGAR